MPVTNDQIDQGDLCQIILDYKRVKSAVLLFLLLLSVISRHTGLHSAISLSLILLAYAILISTFILNKTAKLRTERASVILFLLLTVSMFLSTIYNLTLDSLLRFVVFAVFTSINLFIIPQVIDFEDFLFVFGRITALLVLIGFLPYLGFPTQTGPVNLSLWGGQLYWYPTLSPITSVFVAVNWLGFLTLTGVISALGEWWLFKSTTSGVILVVNIIGLLFTNYRTGWVGLFAAVGILAVYTLLNREAVKLAVLGGITATMIALAMIFNILPGPTVLSELSLNHRRGSWITGVQVLQDQFFWGHGFGNTADVLAEHVPPSSPANVHNSYLRAFIGLGIGGGLAYLGLFLMTMIKSASQIVSKSGVILVMLLVSYFVVQMFNSLSFVGISLHSVVIAITMGYQIID